MSTYVPMATKCSALSEAARTHRDTARFFWVRSMDAHLAEAIAASCSGERNESQWVKMTQRAAKLVAWDKNKTHLCCTCRESHGKLLHFWNEYFVVEIDYITTRFRSVNGVPATYNFRLRSTALSTSLIPIIDLLSGLLLIRLDILNKHTAIDVTGSLRLVAVEFHDVSECMFVLIRLDKKKGESRIVPSMV